MTRGPRAGPDAGPRSAVRTARIATILALLATASSPSAAIQPGAGPGDGDGEREPATASSSPQRPAVPTVERIREALETGDPDEASRLARERLAFRREEHDTWLLLGRAEHRAGRIERARDAFREALRLDGSSLDARLGLAYAELAGGEAVRAEDGFRAVLDARPEDLDARLGLARAQRRQGRLDEALSTLGPVAQRDVPEVRDLLERLLDERFAASPPAGDGSWREARSPRPGEPEILFRAGEQWLERREPGGGFRPLVVRGVNLGVALPGRFPVEFPEDPAVYRDWLDRIAGLGFNAVRTYTLLPPAFYRALRDQGEESPDRALLLIQGVWIELPPGHDLSDPLHEGEVLAEIDRVVDALHGDAVVAPRPGHASGVYTADVSRRTLALLVGRELEPFAVLAHDRMPARGAAGGGYLRARDDATPTERWVARLLDRAAARETERWGAQRPLAFTSWPPLDPLHHPTEATLEEENAWRQRRGEPVRPVPAEVYDNDAVALDVERIVPTGRFHAGTFASYHVYPYYPDFLGHEPRYREDRDGDGRSDPFGAYLEDLRRHHRARPLLVAEYGVPSSRGVAHLSPSGMHHGGHTETEQGEILARLTRAWHGAGCAGGLVFAWLDEWTKATWITRPFHVLDERNRLWFDALDPEQSFGLLAARPGPEGGRVLDGLDDDWEGEPALEGSAGRGVREVRVAADPGWLWILLRLEPRAGPFASGRCELYGPPLLLLLDTVRDDRGATANAELGEESWRTETGVEFEVRIAAGGSVLRVVEPYDLGSHADWGPYTSPSPGPARFVSPRVRTNLERIGRDGTVFPALLHDRGPLRAGTDSLGDYCADAARGVVELRLPWGLLAVTDPSSPRAVFQEEAHAPPATTVRLKGFRIGAGLAPDGPPARLSSRWLWPGWGEPEYHLQLKASARILARALAALSDEPPGGGAPAGTGAEGP